MRRIKSALLGSLLLCATTAAWAAGPTAPAPAEPAVAATAASPASTPLLAALLNPAPQSALTIPCPPEPITECNSCLYFGIQTSYQCTTYCVNGVFHRSCNTCGQGCNL